LKSPVRLRTYLLLAAALVLLTVAELSAAAPIASLSASSHAVAARPFGSLMLAAFTALLLVASVLGVVIVYVLRPSLRRGKDDEPEWVPVRPPMGRLERALALTVPLLLVAGVVVALVLAVHGGHPQTAITHVPISPPAAGSAATRPGDGVEPHPPSDVGTSWETTGLVAGVLIVAGVASALLVGRAIARRRRSEGAIGGAAADDIVARASALSLEELRRESDPRRAILAAYARMEGLFMAAGLARSASETSTEYLSRVLHASSAPRSALLELTLLFEEARFSSHELSAADKDDAVDALVEIDEALV